MLSCENLIAVIDMRGVNPAIAPRPKAVGGTVVQQPVGGRDVAPIGAELSVPPASLDAARDTFDLRRGILSGVEGLPVGLHDSESGTQCPQRGDQPFQWADSW